ncbi:sensor histidine kinase [Pseudoalteromonas sp. Of7M-16]|uniref:HAMP domain-containing sensor histidine kinase n=1 Tax=Pseudoalteromonas sp. Of7M-16 TaxID=2917756 RepID=UPI001EF4CF57|nr:sensor histidine kinase [Pseudoalteromonas sp. Of7M-16]MCG7547564.1 sensor histidine kinase [Pseudoalteromonas sp. Of7M-16]
MFNLKASYFLRLCALVIAGSIILFGVIDYLVNHTEFRMSQIKVEHQEELIALGQHAEQLFLNGDMAALSAYVKKIEQAHNTWAAVVQRELTPLADTQLQQYYLDEFTLGRNVRWKIHLYFPRNPVMDIPFADDKTHFLIQLPSHMRPGNYWKVTYIVLQFFIPFLVLAGICWLLYRAIMKPLKQLEQTTRAFADGDLDSRVGDKISSRDTEFKQIAATFDKMAHCTANTIRAQRQFIADFSHEIRTPIARIETALECHKSGLGQQDMLVRVAKNTHTMRELAENTLTLTWLENERFCPHTDTANSPFDLVDLIDCIAEEVKFEAPHLHFQLNMPETQQHNSDARVLGQVIENVLRNASRYAKKHISVVLDKHTIQILDDGPGVAESELEDIFQPFYRSHGYSHTQPDSHSFGLGLALCKRQMERLNGHIYAQNTPKSGLCIVIEL